MELLFHYFFIICHPYIPLHFVEMIFILVIRLDCRCNYALPFVFFQERGSFDCGVMTANTKCFPQHLWPKIVSEVKLPV